MIRISRIEAICKNVCRVSLNCFGGKNVRFLANRNEFKNVHATLSIRNGIGVIKLISPGKVNVLNASVLEELRDLMDKIENDSNIKGGVLMSNKIDCFIAGADINMLSACKTKEELQHLAMQGQDMLNRLEQSKKPIVAAIIGSCLGGGLEVAMACHYRIAVNKKSTFGLPEVLLGLLPGGGGTQRLPKLIGLPDTLDIILTGKNIRADKAKSLGLVDQIIQPLGPGLMTSDERTLEYLEEVSVSMAEKLAMGEINIKREPTNLYAKIANQAFKIKYVKDFVFNQAKAKVMKQTHGLYPAPLRILQVVRTGLDKGPKAGYKEEAKAFGELAMTNESKGLISLFTGQTECKRNKFGPPKNKKRVNTIGVIGAGLMGAGIAQVSIQKGFNTILNDSNIQGLTRGEKQIQEGIDNAVKRKKMTTFESEKYMSKLIPTLDPSFFARADIVIEAVFENIELKQNLLKEVESIIGEDCIYATNTSTLPISEIAKLSKRPDKVIGMHYFSPVDKMQLLEIIKSDQTSQETLRVATNIALKQGKIPIIVRDYPAFYTSRVMGFLLLEVHRLMLEGVDPKRLDKLSTDVGFPVGSVTLLDEIGLDVGYHTYLNFRKEFGERANIGNPKLGAEFMEAGILGRKSGKGVFLYNATSKEKLVNEVAMKILKKYRMEPKVPLTDETIKIRLLTSFINESVICLEKGIISNPLEGDIGAVFGLGFPPFTGGPFHYVDAVGAEKFVTKMKEFEQHYGVVYKPCQLLVDHCNSNAKFFP